MEQQAKERLTGGVILVVLLVLLIPELLTGPRPVLPAVPVQPDQAPMRSYTLPLGDAGHADHGPVAASTAAPPASELATTTHAPAVPNSAPPMIEPAPTAQAAAHDPPLPKPPAPTPAASVRHGVAPPHVAGAWTVQLGTFSNRENATKLASGLKSHGFTATISEATKNGHRLFRVRVGAERDRAAAQKLQGRLRAAGEKGGEIVPR